MNYVIENLMPMLTDEVRHKQQLDAITLWFIALASSLFTVPENYRRKCLEQVVVDSRFSKYKIGLAKSDSKIRSSR